jgi:hypothetical protein
VKGTPFTVAAGIALAACATSGSANDERHYLCVLQRPEAGGTLTVTIEVAPDGGRRFHQFSWASPSPRDAARVSIEWIHVLDLTRADDMTVTLALRRSWRAGLARIELFRTEDRLRSRTLTGPTFDRYTRYPSLTVPLGRLREFAAGASSLTVAAVGANGRLLAQHPVDMVPFESVPRAIAAARPQIETMAADFRQRCALAAPDRVVVT